MQNPNLPIVTYLIQMLWEMFAFAFLECGITKGKRKKKKNATTLKNTISTSKWPFFTVGKFCFASAHHRGGETVQ